MILRPRLPCLPAIASRHATLSITVMLIGFAVWRILTVARDQLAAEYDLSYEGPQVRSIALFASDGNPYSKEVYNDVPFVITFYPPLYPLLVALFPAHGNVFLIGRIVSLCCMLVAGCCIVASTRGLTTWSFLTCASFFLLWPVSTNAAFVKCDSLALALSAASIVILQHRRTCAGVCGAAVLAVMAIAAKQSFVSALIAGFLFLWKTDNRAARAYAAAILCSATAAGTAASMAYGEGFWRAVTSFSTNAVTPAAAVHVLLAGLCQPMLLALIGIACTSAIPVRKQLLSFNTTHVSLPALYAVCSFVIALLTLGKEGSSTNYLLEPAVALCMTLANRRDTTGVVGQKDMSGLLASLLLVCCAFWDTVACDRSAYNLTHLPANRGAAELVVRRRSAIAALAGERPKILNLAWASLTAELPGEVSLSDPFGQLLLYEAASLDVDPLVDSIHRTYYDLIVIYPGIADRFLSSPSPVGRLGDALRRRYRPAGLKEDVFCWIPAGQVDRSAPDKSNSTEYYENNR